MLRVLHLIDSGGLYGAEIVILNLMEAQKEIELSPILLSIGDIGDSKKDIEVEAQVRGVECVQLRLRKGFDIKAWKKILNKARTLGVDIIHSHGYKSNILLGMLPRKFRRIPVITTLHGWTSTRLFSKIWIYKILDVVALKNLDAVVAVSSNLSKHLLLKTLKINTIIINNGVPKLNFSVPKEFPDILDICNHKYKLLSIGRLSPEKGIDILISALNKVANNSMDIGLVIVGEGSERSKLMELVEKNKILDRVHFTGYLPDAFCLMPYFDAFVLPSHTEGFPITVLEAMQAGVPIAATQVGDIPVILDGGRYGSLVASGDANALAGAIKEVLLCKNVAMIKGRHAQAHALKEYGVEKMARKYYQLYIDVERKFGGINIK